MLQGKKILIGVCGSIAAYKSAEITRLLVKAGVEVRIIMTPAAKDFITPLTFSTLSKHPVLSNFSKKNTGQWNSHVELGLWADLLLIAPVTANTLAKMAIGQCDNLLMATYLSARCPIVLAPAMDLDMYAHPSVTKAMATLKSYGNQFIEAEYGDLASGLVGKGRLAEPEHILSYLKHLFNEKKDLEGKKVLITAGPTHESIDPVRFIGNHSSGKMGIALAEAAQRRGADVTLVIGPTNESLSGVAGELVRVVTAEEMYQYCTEKFEEQDVVILAAAVADYAPAEIHKQKIKKSGTSMTLQLTQTIDIALSLGKRKTHQFIVGFALETEKELEHARAKLEKKNLDLIILNSLNDPGAGFQHDTNKISILNKENKVIKFELKSKKEAANDIMDEIVASI